MELPTSLPQGSPRSIVFPGAALDEADSWARSISHVTVICSSSRGGSSVLFRALAQSTEILSPRGEEMPLLRASIPTVRSSIDDSAVMDFATPHDLAVCRRALFEDVGVGLSQRRTDDLPRYIRDLRSRLPLQWRGVTPELVEEIAFDDLDSAGCGAGGWDALRIFRRMIARLGEMSLIDPRYYDNDPLLDGPLMAGVPAGPPPGANFLEEPPFIPLLPRVRPDVCWPTRILMKSPATCHCLELIQALFPAADIGILHLTRNPAAAVNGLIDGWLHWGFFSRDVSELGIELAIPGYSDRFAWGDRWWNFDLPPGWKEYLDHPLQEVCGFQWLTAHRDILNFVDRHRPRYLRLPFEDLIGDPAKRYQALRASAEFTGIRDPTVCTSELPGVIMATSQPSPGRWRRRESLIQPVITGTDIRTQAGEFGYPWKDRMAWM